MATHTASLPVLPTLHNITLPAKVEEPLPTDLRQAPASLPPATTRLEYTLENAKKQLRTYAEMKKEDGKMIEFSLFIDSELELLEDMQLCMILETELQQTHFESAKSDFQKYLTLAFGKPITVISKVFVSDSPRVNRLVSNSDKYTYLANQFPILEELRRIFGLDYNI